MHRMPGERKTRSVPRDKWADSIIATMRERFLRAGFKLLRDLVLSHTWAMGRIATRPQLAPAGFGSLQRTKRRRTGESASIGSRYSCSGEASSGGRGRSRMMTSNHSQTALTRR